MNKKRAWLAIPVLLAIFLLNLGFAAPVSADGNNDLNRSFRYILQGDVVSAGVGLRGVGFGDIVLNDIPVGATVYRAYLYWATIGNANTYTSPTLDGFTVFGDLIGTSGDTCWGAQNNFVYRAEVSDIVTGNGTYTIAGLPDDLVATGNDSQGASLVVIYSDPAEASHTIIMRDGAVSLNFTKTSYTDLINDVSMTGTVADAHITYLIGDGQEEYVSGSLLFEETNLGENIFSGGDGDYWDDQTFDVTSLVTGAPVSTTINDEDPGNPDSPDCILVAATIMSIASELPPVENNLSQSYERKLFGDVTSAGVGLRGTGEGFINLSGIPDEAVVADAYLYWATLGSDDTFTSPELDGINVNGELIGTSADTCWGANYNFVYRANVTDQVDGNGDYYISGLPDDLENTFNDSQGASLVVVYFYQGLYRWVFINDGAVTLDTVEHDYTDTIGPFTVEQPSSQAHITYLIGDGQEAFANGDVVFDGTTIANNVFTGEDGDFWGTLRFDVTNIVEETDATTTINNENVGDPTSPDCILWAATIFSVQTEQPVLENPVFLPIVLND